MNIKKHKKYSAICMIICLVFIAMFKDNPYEYLFLLGIFISIAYFLYLHLFVEKVDGELNHPDFFTEISTADRGDDVEICFNNEENEEITIKGVIATISVNSAQKKVSFTLENAAHIFSGGNLVADVSHILMEFENEDMYIKLSVPDSITEINGSLVSVSAY